MEEKLPPGWIVFALGGARLKLAGDGPVGHVLVGKREKDLVMRGGGAPEVLTNYGAPDEKRNQSDMEVLVTY